MANVTAYLDCGCAIYLEGGGRMWCPSCEGNRYGYFQGGYQIPDTTPRSHMPEALTEIHRLEAEQTRLQGEVARLRGFLCAIRDSNENDLGVFAEFCYRRAIEVIGEKETP